MSNKAYIDIAPGKRLCLERDAPFTPRLIESNRAPTLTQSIEAACLDIETLSDKVSKFVFSTEGLGESIKNGVVELGKKIVEKIKWLLGKIAEFFQGVISFFGEKFHQYVTNNIQLLRQKLASKIQMARDEMDYRAQDIDLKMGSGPVYAIILGSMKFSQWFRGAAGKIAMPLKKIESLINRKANSPEEAEQMAQEVEQATEEMTKVMEEGKGHAKNVKAPKSKKEELKVLDESLTMSSVLDNAKDIGAGLLKKAQGLLNRANTNLNSAINSGQTEAVKVWSKITTFWSTFLGHITGAPLFKGIIHRDKEVIKVTKETQANQASAKDITHEGQKMTRQRNPQLQPA